MAVFAVLTLLVWGLFAHDRGLWQDDLLTLAGTSAQPTLGLRFFSSITSPTRVLIRVPYALALLTGSPVVALQLLYGALWLLSGVLSARILLQICPGNRWLAYLGGCLTICSTGDFLTDSLVALPYEVSAACFFAALLWLLKSWRSGSLVQMIPAAALLSWSVWTTDAAFASIILTPGLLLLLARFRLDRRLLWVTAVWYAVFLPYFIAFLRFLLNPRSYAAVAIVPASFATRLVRTAGLFFHNFDFWSWGPGRRNWFPALPHVLPDPLCLWLSIAGTLAFLLAAGWIRSALAGGPKAEGESPAKLLGAAGFCLLAALGSNATFALVQESEFFYRTQIVSRYWVSMAIALAVVAVGRIRILRFVEFAVPALFVGFGIFGGLDRQDYYLAFWQRHRAELKSLLETVPGAQKHAFLVVRVSGVHPYMATDAGYLLGSWLTLFSGDVTYWKRSYLWSADVGTSCDVDDTDLLCSEASRPRVRVFPMRSTILVNYVNDDDCFELVTRDNFHALFGEESPPGYRPRRLIVPGPPPPMAQRLLYGRDGLSRFLPEPKASAEGP